jgi:hypothetical protein
MWKERKLRKKKYRLDWNRENKESPAPLACLGGVAVKQRKLQVTVRQWHK